MKKSVILILFLLPMLVFAQKKAKWINLFDGKSTSGWHTWNETTVKGWHVMNGVLMTHGGSGDLVSDKDYENYILEFEFMVEPKGNSGIIYKVLEDPSNKELFAPYAGGPEYQIIDDVNYADPLNDVQKTGANYDIQAPSDLNVVKAPGQWNKGKLIINNNKIEHWLNGKLLVAYTYGDDKWKADVAKSKFAKWPYATPHARGKISLQDHGHAISFKKIRIKEL